MSGEKGRAMAIASSSVDGATHVRRAVAAALRIAENLVAPITPGPLSDVADVRWRQSKAPAKLAVEGRQIAEAGGERDVRDGAVGAARVGQHAVHAVEAQAEHEPRQRDVLALEELADVARAYAMPQRQGAGGDVSFEVLRDVGLDVAQPCGARPAAGRNLSCIACRPKCQANDILDRIARAPEQAQAEKTEERPGRAIDPAFGDEVDAAHRR